MSLWGDARSRVPTAARAGSPADPSGRRRRRFTCEAMVARGAPTRCIRQCGTRRDRKRGALRAKAFLSPQRVYHESVLILVKALWGTDRLNNFWRHSRGRIFRHLRSPRVAAWPGTAVRYFLVRLPALERLLGSLPD